MSDDKLDDNWSRTNELILQLIRLTRERVDLEEELHESIECPMTSKKDVNGNMLRKHDVVRFAMEGRFDVGRNDLQDGLVVGETEKMVIVLLRERDNKDGTGPKYLKRAPKNVVKVE